MAIPHVQAGDLVNLSPIGDARPAVRSHALFKGNDLELMRIVMQQGDVMPTHSVAGESTLQCLEGRVVVSRSSGERELAAGQLMHLARGDAHGLRCIERASLLVTIALVPDAHRGVKR
ncbi:MAG: hypothetical protein EOO24_01545 [Comamonadaceae bacterium]|nr:MAG: hypothetical protein EOO24_01545 [Comamonadaceae bacterium]